MEIQLKMLGLKGWQAKEEENEIASKCIHLFHKNY